MTLADWLRQATPDQREACARQAATSVNRLYQLAGGHRQPSARACHDIAAGTGYAVTPHDLRPEFFPHQADGLPPEFRARAAV